MRIEGTYTFSGTVDLVLSAVMDAERLTRALPGCERLIQLGPPDDEGQIRYEARLRGEASGRSTTVSCTARVARRPARVAVDVRGYGPHGPMEGSGRLDLVAQDRHTVVAYVWEMTVPGATEAEQRALAATGRAIALSACERLNAELLAEAATQPASERQPALVEARTSRGRIIAVSRRATTPALAFRASVWTQRASWMGTGFALGIGAIGLTLNTLRRIAEREQA